MKDGASTVVQVGPGPHVVCVKIDWCRSPELHVDVGVSDDIELICEPGDTGFSSIYAITFGRKRYISLKCSHDRVPRRLDQAGV